MAPGECGPRGQSVTRVVMVAVERDIDSVTTLSRSMVGLNAQESDTKQKTVTQRIALVSARWKKKHAKHVNESGIHGILLI